MCLYASVSPVIPCNPTLNVAYTSRFDLGS